MVFENTDTWISPHLPRNSDLMSLGAWTTRICKVPQVTLTPSQGWKQFCLDNSKYYSWSLLIRCTPDCVQASLQSWVMPSPKGSRWPAWPWASWLLVSHRTWSHSAPLPRTQRFCCQHPQWILDCTFLSWLPRCSHVKAFLPWWRKGFCLNYQHHLIETMEQKYSLPSVFLDIIHNS